MRNAKPKTAIAKQTTRNRANASADTSLRISAAEFVAWQTDLGLSSAAAARLLYVSENTLAGYRVSGADPGIARQCRAILAGIDPADTFEHCKKLGQINAILKTG
jgi:hypothetical protein